MYLTRYDRWASPLYLIGESYGTTRAAGLAGYLVDHGIAFNGLILVSCALDFRGFVFSDANDAPFRNFLPVLRSLGVVPQEAAGRLANSRPRRAPREVEEWTDKEYVSILAQGDQLGGEAHRNAVSQLARFTGLKAGEIEAANLRITQPYFCKQLLESDRRSIGRFDARYKGVENSPAAEAPALTRAWRESRTLYVRIQQLRPHRATLPDRRPVSRPG